jgi:hypothetical protein
LTVEAPANRVTELTVESIVPEVCSAKLEPAGESKYRLSLSACVSPWMVGTKQVAWLRFNTVSNQSSAFVELAVGDITGVQVNGDPVRNFAPQSGRLAVIGEEPMLEAVLKPETGAGLLLYGRPGWECDLQMRPTLDPGGTWSAHSRTTLTNLCHELPVDTLAKEDLYIRALRQR